MQLQAGDFPGTAIKLRASLGGRLPSDILHHPVHRSIMGFRHFAWISLLLTSTALAAQTPPTPLAPIDDGFTRVHEPGRCALKGSCGKKSFFGKPLPCPSNTQSEDPSDETREKLVGLCGAKWKEGPVCCTADQVDALKSNLKQADSIISSCPACLVNFHDLFCTFTCSPDQSLFVNVTEVQQSNSKQTAVKELKYLISEKYGQGFFDSCKDVKFGATNGYAMDFIGGGAKDKNAFLKFLGDQKTLGSPFQLDFPITAGNETEGMEAMHNTPKKCNDPDPQYRCACVDCPDSCTQLPAITENKECHVGALPCLSFTSIFLYSTFLLLAFAGGVFHVLQRRQEQSRQERVRLLQDAMVSDSEEDEGYVARNAGSFERPVRQYRLNAIFDRAFSKLGRFCATYPAVTILASLAVIFFMSLGWFRLSLETSPERLWVSPTSEAAKEKAFFDKQFGPFFRAEQVFLVNDSSTGSPAGPVLSHDTLSWWFEVEKRIRRLKSVDHGLTLEDVCFKPTGDACVVQSIAGYFDQKPDLKGDEWKDYLRDCTAQPVNCLPNFQQPLRKELLLGGWEDSGDVIDANAMIVTWVVNNYAEGTVEEEKAMDWEESLKNLLLNSVQLEAADRGLRLSFNTEISLEQELNKSSNQDAKIVVISYFIMFLYASLALGSSAAFSLSTLISNPSTALVRSKFGLGVIGIGIVLLSVSASVGFFAALGIKVTLIIAEVIPFLVLAVGVDNIFLLVHEFDRVNHSHPDVAIETRVAKALGRMGPSILLSAVTETVTFALGAFVGMPAVRNFAIYAAGAVFVNAVLQVTLLISVLALDQKRVESRRLDCFPCVKAKSAKIGNGHVEYAGRGADTETLLQRFIRRSYAPWLLSKKVKAVVLTVFLGFFAAGVALLPELELGLDQRIAIPSDSYLIPYFNDLYDYFDAGPPVYFVSRNSNSTQRKHQQELCGRFTTCSSWSVANVLEGERKRSDVSYIAEPSASWIDDFLMWLNPLNDQCCIENGKVCFEDRNPPWDITLAGMPEGHEFMHYLSKWIESPTTEDCPSGGKAPYSNALSLNPSQDTVTASHFRTSHTPLKSQQDFITAYASARRIASEINAHTSLSIFPYSKFYIFFDQYATIVRLTSTLLSLSLLLILAFTTLILGSFRTALVLSVTVGMTLICILGTLVLFRVSLNAVSLVNLIICTGIAVEFCAHIARAFTFPSAALLPRAEAKFRSGNGGGSNGNRDARAWTALVAVGGSVFSGITVTKLLGVATLAFTRSKIFEVYYFRMWVALVLWAALHALVFLPVALSVAGGRGYAELSAAEDDGGGAGAEEDLASRRYRALMPEDEEDSDED